MMTVRYYTRLATLLFFILAGSFLVGGALLIPSYIASSAQADSFEQYRDALAGSIGLKERGQTESTVLALAERLRIVKEHHELVRVVDVLETLFAKQSSTILIDAVSLSRTEGGVTIKIAGVADTRAALIAFVDVVRADTAFSNVALPVAQLVIEKDVPFSLGMEYRIP